MHARCCKDKLFYCILSSVSAHIPFRLSKTGRKAERLCFYILLAGKRFYILHYSSWLRPFYIFHKDKVVLILISFTTIVCCKHIRRYAAISNPIVSNTVEPRYNEGPKDWQNVFVIMRFRCIDGLFRIFYYYWGQENRSLNRGLRYIEVR